MTDSVRLKWLLAESDMRAGAEAEELPLLSVSISWGVRRREASDMTTRAASEDLSNYKLCCAGDLVINRMRAFQGALGIAPEAGVVSPDYAVLRVDSKVDKRWLNYYLTSDFTVSTMASMVRGIGGTEAGNVRTPRLNVSDLQSITAPLTSAEEQRAVADYLDRETTRIDTLIEEQQRLIEMLRGRRAAVITQAATRGLDGAPLVDSGNVYLGAVPAHWTVSRFSREMDVNGGQVDPRDDPWTDMVLVAPNHIESGTGRIVGRETAREQGADSGKYLADAGQILYSKIRPALNKVAVAAEDCLTSADMYAMSSRRGDDHRYLMYFMLARPFHSFATLTSLRVKMPKINRDELGEAPFLRPPVEEQRKIVAYLDEQTAKIDVLIAETERFIELARERRAALITAAVTGQIDVREMA
jgi:type I restriction enzyme, S subunit